jgi:S-phase kinase-associated protein 1
MSEVMLKLLSSEGIIYEVEESAACKSELIKDLVDCSGNEGEIPLPDVKSETLKKVIEYCRHYKDSCPQEIEKPIKSAILNEIVPSWDADFVELGQEELFELILAANYLRIKGLIDLTCAKVAAMLKGKTAEEITKQFGIENSFTPEEEEEIRKSNKWAELE